VASVPRGRYGAHHDIAQPFEAFRLKAAHDHKALQHVSDGQFLPMKAPEGAMYVSSPSPPRPRSA
jgi:hypothetical protein